VKKHIILNGNPLPIVHKTICAVGNHTLTWKHFIYGQTVYMFHSETNSEATEECGGTAHIAPYTFLTLKLDRDK
jgi:hypothetical protein